MRIFSKITALFLLFISYSITGFSQETTAILSGVVADGKGTAVGGATVSVLHQPTGTSLTAQTNNKGLFVLPNLRPGGPYTIKISFVGFEEQKYEGVNLSLGANPELRVDLKTNDKALQEVVVNSTRRSATSGLSVGRAQMNTLPTLGRSLSDFTRVTPQANNNSFAGTNFRYNNITLDGAVNNDAIGFSNSFGGTSGGGQSGTAGSGSRTNPYSIDVIQEVQVQLSPYDVKLGNFTGGSVNAVTKSGTNTVHGSAYGYGRSQVLVGKSPNGAGSKIGSDFYDYQYGATLSGPIIKNKLFFIVNGEITRRQEPTFYNAGDPGAISVADAQRVVAAYRKAGFDAGSYDRYRIFTNSDKLFARIDYNINAKNSLLLRAIYTAGSGNNLERTNTTFQFSSTDFTQHTKNLNLVAELKSTLSNSVSNNLIVSHINVHDYRDFPGSTPIPYVDITAGSANIWAGTWREASIYNMKQKTIEVTDNLTWTKGINKLTFGTHNEFYNFDYGFLQAWNGRWQYSSLANFEANKPGRVRGTFALDNSKNNFDNLQNNTPGADYKVGLLSAYAQDELALSRTFKITPGVRFDYSYVGDQPKTDGGINSVQDSAVAAPTYTHTAFSNLDNKWFGHVTVSPRLGFTWNASGNGAVTVRGGSGIFTGRIPFAWLGYAYTLNGNDYGNIDWNIGNGGTVVPLAAPANLKTAVDAANGGANTYTKTRELDLIDNNFKLPTIWRSSLATDIKWGKGYKLTLDALYTKTIYDVKFEQIALQDVAEATRYYTTGSTQTPFFTRNPTASNYSAIYLLTNTKEGHRYNLTAQLSKATNGIRIGKTSALNLSWSLAYTYGMSKDVANGIRNSFSSNYEYNPTINPNNSELSYSNFDLRHRIVGVVSTAWKWNEQNTTSLSFFYSSQAGSPYSLVYTSVPFGSGSSGSLPYIPKSQSDINLVANGTYTAAQQWADLNAFIEGDSYLKSHRGQYAERNALRTPWNHTLDAKLLHEFKIKTSAREHTLALSLDVFNVLNLLNNDWGHINFVTNTNNYTVNFLKFAADAAGKAPGAPVTGYVPTFQFLKPTGVNNQYYSVDPINSRWQGQVGVKYSF